MMLRKNHFPIATSSREHQTEMQGRHIRSKDTDDTENTKDPQTMTHYDFYDFLRLYHQAAMSTSTRQISHQCICRALTTKFKEFNYINIFHSSTVSCTKII